MLVVAVGAGGLFAIAVEGKVDQEFGKPVREWLGSIPSSGKLLRLRFLSELLGLHIGELSEMPYQSIHRSASVVIEAGRLAATPMVLVHSWGRSDEGFEDCARFAALMGGETKMGRAVLVKLPDEKQIWFTWVRGDERWRQYRGGGGIR